MENQLNTINQPQENTNMQSLKKEWIAPQIEILDIENGKSSGPKSDTFYTFAS